MLDNTNRIGYSLSIGKQRRNSELSKKVENDEKSS